MKPALFARRHRITTPLAVVLLLAAWLLAWIAVSAQTFPPLVGVTADNTGNLNTSQIGSAAQELQKLGVKPLVVFSNDLGGVSDINDFADKAIANYGLTTANGSIDPNLLAIAVTLNPRQLAVVWGDGLNGVMADPPEGQGFGTKILPIFLCNVHIHQFNGSGIINIHVPPEIHVRKAPATQQLC